MLCDHCEQYLGDAENYLAILSRGKRDELSSSGIKVRECASPNGSSRLVMGADGARVFRGLVGILFKSVVAPTSPNVELSESDKRIVKADLLSGHYPTQRYALLATKMMDYGATGMNPKGRGGVWLVSNGRLSLFWLALGGVLWQLMCDLDSEQGHIRELVDDPMFGDHWWQGQSTWKWMVGDVRYMAPMVGPDIDHDYDDATAEGYLSDLSCPCGSSSTFRECCLATWA